MSRSPDGDALPVKHCFRSLRVQSDQPQSTVSEQERLTLKVRGAKHDIIEGARRLNALVAEFPDEPSIWGEYLNALCDAVDRLIVAETEAREMASAI